MVICWTHVNLQLWQLSDAGFTEKNDLSGCYFCLCHDLTRSLGKCSYWPPKCWDWSQRSWAAVLIGSLYHSLHAGGSGGEAGGRRGSSSLDKPERCAPARWRGIGLRQMRWTFLQSLLSDLQWLMNRLGSWLSNTENMVKDTSFVFILNVTKKLSPSSSQSCRHLSVIPVPCCLHSDSRGSAMNCSVISVSIRAPLESRIRSISRTWRQV